MRAQVRESTWYGYRIAVDRLVEQLGEVRLQSLTPLQVETAYAKLRKDGGRYGGPLAPKTVRNCHIVLHRGVVDAVRLGPREPQRRRHRPPAVGASPESVTWTAEELEAFLEHVSDDRLFPAYIVLAPPACVAARCSACAGPTSTSTTVASPSSQTLQCTSTAKLVSTTKTNRSRRTVSLDPVTVDVLKASSAQDQAEERLALGPAYDTSRNLVFAKQDGSPVHPDVFSRCLQEEGRRSRPARAPGPHNLRHTWATLVTEGRRPPQGRQRPPRARDDRRHHRHLQPRRPQPRRRRGEHGGGGHLRDESDGALIAPWAQAAVSAPPSFWSIHAISARLGTRSDRPMRMDGSPAPPLVRWKIAASS